MLRTFSSPVFCTASATIGACTSSCVLLLAVALATARCGSGQASPAAGPDATAVDGPNRADAGPGWHIVQSDLDGVVLGIWGTSGADVFCVGGALGGGPGSGRVFHFDGTSWWRMPVGAAPVLWWTFGFAGDDVWAVGEKGTVLHFDGTSWSPVEGNRDETVWGFWGTSHDDLWMVGGSASIVIGAGFIRHFDGQAWRDVESGLAKNPNFYKVWGTGPNDVFVVGGNGVILHFDGTSFAPQASGTNEQLTTVNGRAPDDVYAVGALEHGIILHYDGATWTPASGTADGTWTDGVSGVFAPPSAGVLVGGGRGLLLRARTAAWNPAGFDVEPRLTPESFHVVWCGGAAGCLAGGGNLFGEGPPTSRGVIVADGAIVGTPFRDWPASGVPFDAGSDATPSDGDASADLDAYADAQADADGGAVGTRPGDDCMDLPSACGPGLTCLQVFKASGAAICTHDCAAACTGDCRQQSGCTDFAEPACCQIPGPQTLTPACIPIRLGQGNGEACP